MVSTHLLYSAADRIYNTDLFLCSPLDPVIHIFQEQQTFLKASFILLLRQTSLNSLKHLVPFLLRLLLTYLNWGDNDEVWEAWDI